MRREANKGFTLAELLIVVAIIGVLVAISIPIFSKQLEKARDAVSISNIRAAYAQAMTDALTYNGSPTTGQKPYQEGNDKIYVDANGYVSAVVVEVKIESHSANAWSGLAKDLPFVLTGKNKNLNDNTYGDVGKYTTSYRHAYVNFTFDQVHTSEYKLKYAYFYFTS